MKCTKLEKAILINLLAMNIGVCSAFASNLDGTTVTENLYPDSVQNDTLENVNIIENGRVLMKNSDGRNIMLGESGSTVNGGQLEATGGTLNTVVAVNGKALKLDSVDAEKISISNDIKESKFQTTFIVRGNSIVNDVVLNGNYNLSFINSTDNVIDNNSVMSNLQVSGSDINMSGNSVITTSDTDRLNNFNNTYIWMYQNSKVENSNLTGKSKLYLTQPEEDGGTQVLNNIVLNDNSELNTFDNNNKAEITNITVNDNAEIDADGDISFSGVNLKDDSWMKVYQNAVSLDNVAIEGNAQLLFLNIREGDKLNIVADKGVTDMQITGDFKANGGVVKWKHYEDNNAYNYARKTLTIDNLINDNPENKTNFVLHTDFDGEKPVETVHVKQANEGAAIGVSVLDKSKYGETENKAGVYKKVLVVTDDSKKLTVTGEAIDNGGLWTLTPTIENGALLGESDKEWYLTNLLKQANKNTESIYTGIASDYGMWRYTNDTLRKRLGDLRAENRADDGVWLRTYHGKLDGDSFTNNYHTYQLGYDKTVDEYTYGLAFERSEGNMSYSNGSGNTDLNAFSLYGTYLGEDGQYADLVLRAGRLNHEMDTYGEFGENSDYDNNAYSISLEYGRQQNYDDGWFATPQAQVTFGRMNSADFTTSRGTKVNADSMNSLIGRLGIDVGRNVDNGSSYYMKLGAFREFAGERDISMRAANGDYDSRSYDYGDTWFEIGIGGQLQAGDNTYVYCDAERSFGGDIDKKWQINAGVRYSF